jgi:WD40 repeat protein
MPLDFNAQNFNQFTGVISYGSALAKHFNKEMFEIYTYAQDYSADGSTIAIGGCIVNCSSYPGGKDFLLLIDTYLEQPILDISVDTLSQIWDVDLNPDGSTLIFSIRGKVLRYDRATGLTTEVYTPKNELQLPFDSISPDGRTLVIVTESELLVLNLLDGSEIIRLSGAFWGQNSPFFNAQGNHFTVYTQRSDRDVIVYDTDTWTELARLPLAGNGKATVSSDGKVIATLIENDSFVKLYNIESGNEKKITISPYTEVTSITFNPSNDLLLTFGNPGDMVDFYEGVQVINLQNGKVIGSLTQEVNPGRIKFSADGKSFLRLGFEATNMTLWSLPTPDIQKIEKLIQDYFAVISSGDYQSAADMTQLDSYAREEVVATGLNPDDLPETFTALCKEDEVPCLPLKRIVRVMADFDRGWDYYAIVTLEKPDGSEIMFDDYTPYELLGILQLDDGSFKISTLHPGMRYPYQE